MKRMKIIGYILCGVLIGGVLLNGDATNAVAGLMAERSSQPIYVDGQKVELEAYNIAGSNYVKLRDIGKAVGFNVSWDGSAVQIDSDTPYSEDIPATSKVVNQKTVAGRTIPLKNIPEVGDRILCDDGTTYEDKDTYRFENNVYAPEPLPELPTPTCDWAKYPLRELPIVEVKHYNTATGDNLFVRNHYELRRLEFTLYNALGEESSAWRNGEPLATVEMTIPLDKEPYTDVLWPWRESEIVELVHSRPNSRYYIDAWDYYHNGIFQHTRYFILSL